MIKKVFHKKCKVFVPAGIATVMASWFFIFFNSHPYVGFIYPGMEGTGSFADLKSKVWYFTIQLFLIKSWLFSASWENYINSGMSYKSHDIIYTTVTPKIMRNTWELQEITFYQDKQFTQDDTSTWKQSEPHCILSG